jgi:hypothetical protein
MTRKANSQQAVLDRMAENIKAAPETVAPRRRKTAAAGSREETRLIAGHFPEEYARKVRMIAASEDRTIQSVLKEALEDMFTKKAMPG